MVTRFLGIILRARARQEPPGPEQERARQEAERDAIARAYRTRQYVNPAEGLSRNEQVRVLRDEAIRVSRSRHGSTRHRAPVRW